MSVPATSAVGRLRVTRVTNACVLLELGPYAILTDPWFRKPWGFTERPGLRVVDLPPLTAIIGSHRVFDHWDVRSLSALPGRASLPVLAATPSMVRRAKKAGLTGAECVSWGESRRLKSDLVIEVLPAHRSFGIRTNNYVITSGSQRVFFGGELRRLEPLYAYRDGHPKVDVFLAPVNGMRLLGVRLVTRADEALEGARILGASTFIPIHDSMHSIGFGGPTSSTRQLPRDPERSPKIIIAEPGVPIELEL